MKGISIYLDGQSLDVYDQDIEWSWTNIRFSDGIRDQYSTDITLPKTIKNAMTLEVSGLLDSTTQLYGSQLTPCTLTVNSSIMDVHMQVVSITEDEISICLYERTLPDDVSGKKIRELLHDDYDTIRVWSENSGTAYPNDFPTYNYGSPTNTRYAQRHQSKPLNWVISNLNTQLQNFTLPTVDDSLYLMGAQKKVCPQNPKQMIEFTLEGGSDDIVLVGGQHIVNDLEGYDGLSKVSESTTKEITFNRACTATLKAIISWGRKSSTGLNTFMVSLFRNGVFEYDWQIRINNSTDYRNGYVTSQITLHINEGDTFFLKFLSPTTNNAYSKFELLSGVLEFTYSDYTINDDDYDIDLVYCNRHPCLRQWFPSNLGYYNHWFDGRTEDYYIYNWDSSLNTSQTTLMEFPWRGISYIGYFCNIGDITIKEMYSGLCWLYNKKPFISNHQLVLQNTNESLVLENASISEIRPSSSNLGKKTSVKWCDGFDRVLTEIDNAWLEDEVTRHESPFVYVDTVAGGLAKVNQYEIKSNYNPNTDETSWECNYEEPEGAVLVKYGQYGRHNRWGLLPPPEIKSMGINFIDQCMEVTIKTNDYGVKDIDYVYLDGRKFMVVEGNTDLNTGTSEITALLVTKTQTLSVVPTN